MTDHDFRQFNGAFDSAIEPDSAFTERLQQRMRVEKPGQVAAPATTAVASPPIRIEPAPGSPRRSHPLFVAAAVLIVFALAAASIVQLAPQALEPQYAAQSVATLPADVSTTPGADVALSAESLPELQSVSYTHPHGDNLIAVRYVPPTDVQRLLSYNVQSGEVQWEQDISQLDHFVFSDQVVVGISYSDPEPIEESAMTETTADAAEEGALPRFDEMVGFDLNTGERLWTRSISDWQMKHGWETVVMAGETVVFLRAGEVVGINATTGETLWQTDYDLMAAEENGWVHPPSIVGINGSLYLAQNNGSVVVFDLITGVMVHQFDLPTSLQDLDPINIQIFEVPAGLLVAADSFDRDDPKTTLYVLETENGDLVWERSLDHSGVIDIAPDGSIAIATHTWESPPLLMRLMGQDGHSTSALTWLDADGEVILETDRVRLPDMSGLVVTGNGEFICGTTEDFACFDRAGTRYVLETSILWDAVWVGDTLLVVTDRGVMRVELP